MARTDSSINHEIADFEDRLRDARFTASRWLPGDVLLLRKVEFDEEMHATIRGWDVGVKLVRGRWQLVAVDTWWVDGNVNADGELESPTHENAEAALTSWEQFWRAAEPATDSVPGETTCNWSVLMADEPTPLPDAPREVRLAALQHLSELIDGPACKQGW